MTDFANDYGITIDNSIDDISFLERVIVDLDDGWTVGTMCSSDGKKCLVGAGAEAIGMNYQHINAIASAAMKMEDWDEAGVVDRLTRDIENVVAERFLSLYPELIDPDRSRVGMVTTFNDEEISSYAALRRMLTEKLEELKLARLAAVGA